MTTSSEARAVLVAAGSSERMGAAGERKPFLALTEASEPPRTVLDVVCSAFDAAASVAETVVVAHADDLAMAERVQAGAVGWSTYDRARADTRADGEAQMRAFWRHWAKAVTS